MELTEEEFVEVIKRIITDPDISEEKRTQTIRALSEASAKGISSADYILARLAYDGIIICRNVSNADWVTEKLCSAANAGDIGARAFLNKFCEWRYEKEVRQFVGKKSGPLKDFKGREIKLSRTGIRTPVDAELSYENGRNLLKLSANLAFIYYNEFENKSEFEAAVIKGIKLWSGTYEVFGGQQLDVRVDITTEDRLVDNVTVIPVTSGLLNAALDVKLGKAYENKLSQLKESKRSFAVSGIRKWSTTSRKFIYIQSDDGSFSDYEEIKHVAKHEFGHVIGLGDLYKSDSDSLEGVEQGSYPELDSFHISSKFYNLVMCDHHGMISNNDIEMVVLAFLENRQQSYQPEKFRDRISAALGKGN